MLGFPFKNNSLMFLKEMILEFGVVFNEKMCITKYAASTAF